MPIEYSGEEQAIVAVGLVQPRLGVFVEAIQHLLVLCTTTEVWRGDGMQLTSGCSRTAGCPPSQPGSTPLPSNPSPQIVLLGVCCSRGPGGGGDDCEEVTLQPLPLYSVPADNVTMVTVSSTADGRIFLGGAGG